MDTNEQILEAIKGLQEKVEALTLAQSRVEALVRAATTPKPQHEVDAMMRNITNELLSTMGMTNLPGGRNGS